jgi:5-methylcytosine-specific restriction endonuclease McrA
MLKQVKSFPKEGKKRLDEEDYKKFKIAIFKRDGWKCRNPLCRYVVGDRVTGLTVHHLKKRSHNGDDVPGNAISLCVGCHDKVEANELHIEIVDVVVKFKEA